MTRRTQLLRRWFGHLDDSTEHHHPHHHQHHHPTRPPPLSPPPSPSPRALATLALATDTATVSAIGTTAMTALKKFDISDNKIIELPILFCELSDASSSGATGVCLPLMILHVPSSAPLLMASDCL